MLKSLSCALVAATMFFAAPAAGQPTQSRYDLGEFWHVTMIDIQDGYFEEYMNYVADTWRNSREFARQQGWILDYHILANEYPRRAEPNLFLIYRYADSPSTAETRRRQQILLGRQRTDPQAQDREIAGRAHMRTLAGRMLLRELTIRR